MVQVVLSDDARELLERIRVQRPGRLTMVIGNGCCDSTAPFVFEDYFSGAGETPVAELDGDVTVVLDRALIDLFEGREVVIDAVRVACADSFSCESELGMRFTLARMPAVDAQAASGAGSS
jgi:uncharacterized protein (DUF779 family)